VDIEQIVTGISGLLGGGVLLKVAQVWLAHRQTMDGDFQGKTQAARDNFQLVVVHLENRIEHLEIAEKRCLESNRELENKIRLLEDRIEKMLLRSPWREIADDA